MFVVRPRRNKLTTFADSGTSTFGKVNAVFSFTVKLGAKRRTILSALSCLFSLTINAKDSGKNFQINGNKNKGMPAIKNITCQPKFGVNHEPNNAAITPPTA